MEIELATCSPWIIVFGIAMFVFIILAFIFLIFTVMKSLKPKIGFSLALIAVLACTGAAFGFNAAISALDKNSKDSFNQKLMEEYGATSSRSILDMRRDFYEYNEATTTFTRDGVDTTVFVKRISDDGNNLKMVFTVVDDKSLYPKSGK